MRQLEVATGQSCISSLCRTRGRRDDFDRFYHAMARTFRSATVQAAEGIQAGWHRSMLIGRIWTDSSDVVVDHPQACAAPLTRPLSASRWTGDIRIYAAAP